MTVVISRLYDKPKTITRCRLRTELSILYVLDYLMLLRCPLLGVLIAQLVPAVSTIFPFGRGHTPSSIK
jgi:hypothetical protein